MKVVPDTDASIAQTQRKTTATSHKRKSAAKDIIATEEDAPAGKLPVEKVKAVKKATKTAAKKQKRTEMSDSSATDDESSSSDNGEEAEEESTETPTPATKKKSAPGIRRASSKTVIDSSVVTQTQEVAESLTRKFTKTDDHGDTKFDDQLEMDDAALSPDSVVLTTWNLAGMRGAIKNGLWDKAKSWKRTPDILCVQEIKISEPQLNELPQDAYVAPMKQLGLTAINNFGEKAGYSGVGVWYNASKLTAVSSRTDSSFAYTLPKKKKPVPTGGMAKFLTIQPSPSATTSVDPNESTGIPADATLVEEIAQITGDTVNDGMRGEVWECAQLEGRILTVDFGSFYIVNTYVPNSGGTFDRLSFRFSIYEPVLLEYLLLLEKQKPVIYTGDLNVARDPIDVHTPSLCQKSAGFHPQERDRFLRLIEGGKFTDTFRTFQKGNVHGYTYWGHRHGGRPMDRGWRIDYFLSSQVLQPHLKGSMVTDEFKPTGYESGRISDHAPLWVSFDGAILKQE